MDIYVKNKIQIKFSNYQYIWRKTEIIIRKKYKNGLKKQWRIPD